MLTQLSSVLGVICCLVLGQNNKINSDKNPSVIDITSLHIEWSPLDVKTIRLRIQNWQAKYAALQRSKMMHMYHIHIHRYPITSFD